MTLSSAGSGTLCDSGGVVDSYGAQVLLRRT